MVEENREPHVDSDEPANGGTRGGEQPEESEPGAGNEYPANGGTRGTAPASAAAAQQASERLK